MKFFRNLLGNARKTQEELQSEKMRLDILNDIYQTTEDKEGQEYVHIQRKELSNEEEKRRFREENRMKRQEEERLRKEHEEVERNKPAASIKNSIGMEFVLIPAGVFMMGSNESKDEQPVHKVTISTSFYLGRYAVTQKEWKAVMGINPSGFKANDKPVENVSWNEVQEFIKKFNKKEGTKRYRLPSEAEWEYACRAGATKKYFFGNNESKLDEYVWYDVNSKNETHAVGKKKPNYWGLYDMHGNVYEWVEDKWHDSYLGAPNDASSWEDHGSSSFRVLRGGCWHCSAESCRSAHRIRGYPDFSDGKDLGFRLLREI